MKVGNYVKKFISLSVVAVMTLSILTACGSKDSADSSAAVSTTTTTATQSSTVPAEDEKVSLTVWGTPSGQFDGQNPGEWIEKSLVPEWNAKYPNASVTVELIPFDGINEKLTTSIASGKTPDVFLDYPGRILSYANMGAVAELDDIIPADKLEKVKSNPDIMKMVSVNGKIVVMPYPTNSTMLVVNKTMWEEAGAANLLPQNENRTWTPEEFKAALKAVANKEKGVYGITLFALNEQGDQIYNNVLGGYGVKLFNDDYSKYIAAENPAAEQAFAFFKSIIDEGLCTPHPETLAATNALDYFKQKKNGMIVGGLAHIDIVQNGLKDGSIQGPFEPMIVNYPSTTKDQATLKSEVGSGCVFKNGDDKKVEWGKKFLYYTYADSEVAYNAGKSFDIWGNQKGWMKEYSNQKEVNFVSNVLGKVSEWPLIDPGWGIKGYPEMRAAMFPEMQSMFIGRTTPKQTVDNISTKFNEVITKYNTSK